ncbi:DUF1642 domain-containing protein [Enterococcus casseliflavus]|uniref:DUF1642 domain-containing protein n=4 Tax=Enterococcus casseliflavus TaxID=37734 RepID=UPI0022E5A74C|nr:DUF1642 domain-containing protein [Enterococcus casseliflavus]
MNKQELINNVKAWGAWCTDHNTGEKDRYVKINKVRELVEQLDEQPKITVPQFLDKYIQENKGECASDVFSEEWLHDSADELDDEVDKWLYDNDGTENDRRYLIAVQAFVTGEYEVEKEPKFIVKVGNLYLIEPLGDTYDSTIRTTWNHKNAYKFTIYDMAQTHANKFGGEVEEVK